MAMGVESFRSDSTQQFTVATATDDTYLVPWMVLAYSLNRFHPELCITLAYFEDCLSPASIKFVEQFEKTANVKVRMWNLGSEAEEGHRYISKTTFAKFRYLELDEPVVWLDCDMVVLRPLDGLFEELLKSSLDKPFIVAERDGRPNSGFNAGFFCKREGPQPIPDWQRKVTRTGHNLENQVFTEAFLGRCEFVSENYNTLAAWADPERVKKPIVLHFPGSIKPWQILKFRLECLREGCNWAHWFSAFEELNQLFIARHHLDLGELLNRQPNWEGVRRVVVRILRGSKLSRVLLGTLARIIDAKFVDFVFLRRLRLTSKNLHPIHFRSR